MSVKFLFPVVMTLLFAAIHYLTYSRIVKKLHVAPRFQKMLALWILINFFGIIGYIISRYYMHLPEWLHYLVSLSVGVGFVFFISLLLYELLHLLQRHLPLDPSKRAFFKRSSDLGFLALGAGYLGAGIEGGSKYPRIETIRIDQKRFTIPCRIVQISDMHIGGLIDADFVAHSVAAANALNPDLIAITGDLVDAPIDMLREAVEPLRHLKSRLGTFFVAGNHEYFHGIEATMSYLETLGIRVLRNEAHILENFAVCGVYDYFGWRYGAFEPDIREATRTIPERLPTLLLAHQPRFIDHLEGFEPALILSGHTHGGQIWPFGYLVRLVQPFLKGLHTLGARRHIYVNSGIGFWGPPMRLGSAAEITLIEWS